MTAVRYGRPLEVGQASAIPPLDPGLPPPPFLEEAETAPPELIVHLRDTDAVRVAQIDDYVRLELVMRHHDVGAWILDLHPDSPGFQAFLEVVLAAQRTGEIGHTGIEVTRAGTTVFSGPIAAVRRNRQTDSKTGAVKDTVTLAGPDDTMHLVRRLAMPEPADAGNPPYTVQAYDVRAGVASTVLLAYVNVNVGPGAVTARRVPGLTMGIDHFLGATLPGQQARFQTVLELAQSIAVAGGDLGFGILGNGNGALTFDVYAPTDRSAEIVFSDGIGNLGDFAYEVTAPQGNYVVVGGKGEETLRTILEDSDSASVARWGRIEFFRDRRDSDDLTELAQTADEELATKGEQVAVTITATDTPRIRFGRDYFLGDKVAAVIDGLTIAEVAREVKITKDSTGEKVQPTMSTVGASIPGLPRLLAARRADSRRITSLERR